MVQQNADIVGAGIGFGGLLTILFIGLKLTEHIDWSWWWVLSPIWAPFALFFGLLFGGMAIYIVLFIIFSSLNKEK